MSNATTTRRTLTLASLEETLCKLAQSMYSNRGALLVETGILAMVAKRMLAADEKAYFAALRSYRAIKGPHASVPAGCGIY